MNGVRKLTCVLLLGVSLGVAAAQHEEPHAEGARLLVTDLDSSTASVLELASGKVLGRFSTPGAAGTAYASPSGRYGFVVHRDENRVSVIHSGLRLEDHGDHADLLQGAPYVLHTLNVGREPTHLWAHGDEIVIFNDADGTAALIDEDTLELTLDYTEVEAAQPDHGAAVVLGDTVLIGYYELGRVDAYSRTGERLETFTGCPGLHGEATLTGVAAFGCEDGVLLITQEGDTFTARKLENPAGTPEDVRVSTLSAHEGAAVFVGNFGDGLAFIDPASETLEVTALDAAPLRFAFSHDGEKVLALTASGMLEAYSAATGAPLDRVRVMQPIDASGGYGTYDAPSLTVGEEAVYVGVPKLGQVVEVMTESLNVSRRLDVPGKPGSVALLALAGGTVH